MINNRNNAVWIQHASLYRKDWDFKINTLLILINLEQSAREKDVIRNIKKDKEIVRLSFCERERERREIYIYIERERERKREREREREREKM